MRTSWALALLVAAAGCGDPSLVTVNGALEASDGSPWADLAFVEVMSWDEWTGAVPNGTGPYLSMDVSDASFRVEVEPGTYAAVASRGTCGGVAEFDAEGQAVDVVVVVACVE